MAGKFEVYPDKAGKFRFRRFPILGSGSAATCALMWREVGTQMAWHGLS